MIVQWDDLETFRRFNDSPDGHAAGREMYKDELNFIDLENSCIYLAETKYEESGTI